MSDLGDWGKKLPPVDDAELERESFNTFDFPQTEEDDKLNDETFGDTGPLTDEWEGAHEKLAVVIEHAKPVVPKKEEGFFGFDTNLPKREKPEKLAPYNDEDNEAFDNSIVDDVLADDRNAPTPPPFQGVQHGYGHPQYHPHQQPYYQPPPPGWIGPQAPPQYGRPMPQQQQQGFDPIMAKLLAAPRQQQQQQQQQQQHLPHAAGPGSGVMSVAEIERRLAQQHLHAQSQPHPSSPHMSKPHAVPVGSPSRPQHHQQQQYYGSPSVPLSSSPIAALSSPHQITIVSGSSPVAAHVQQPQQQQRPFRQIPNYKRWQEHRAMMSAEEIDSVIRMQLMQVVGDNPYVEDFYYQNYLRLQGKADLHQLAFHKPICEASPRHEKKFTTELPGVLGRIPSHSIRAPRPLLLAQQDDSNASAGNTNVDSQNQEHHRVLLAVSHSVLLAVEEAYNCLIDVEDIDLVRSALGPPSENAAYLSNKRKSILEELFRHMGVFVPGENTQMVPDPNNHYIFSQDEVFIKLSLIPKGRRLVVRALGVLSPEQLHYVLLAYIRNFRIFVDPPKAKEAEASALFEGVLKSISRVQMPTVVIALQTIYYFYINGGLTLAQFVKIRAGGRILHALLKRAYEFQLEPEAAAMYDASYFATWNELYGTMFSALIGQLQNLFPADQAQCGPTWDFLAILAANGNELQKAEIFVELKEKMKVALKESPWSAVRTVIQNLNKTVADLE